MVKVSSARHWKAISHRLTVNFEGMKLQILAKNTYNN